MKLNIDTENTAEGWEYVGDVSVDAGRVIVADPCYLDDLDQSLSEIVDSVI